MKYFSFVFGLCFASPLLTSCSSEVSSDDQTQSTAAIAEKLDVVQHAETGSEREDAILKFVPQLSTKNHEPIAGENREQIVTLLREVLDESELSKTRARAAEGLGIAKDVDSTPLLIHAMDDDSAEVRAAAGKAFTRIIGIDFGFRANAPEAERRKVAQACRNYYDTHVVGSNLEAVLQGERDVKEFEDDARRRSEAMRGRWPKHSESN